MKHPLQPLYLDEHGTKRFKRNAIVRHLLDKGGIDLNQIACMSFEREDREQFAQLIGYSLSGFGELGYVSDTAYELAEAIYDSPETNAKDEEIARLREVIENFKELMRGPAAFIFNKHPDDLNDGRPL